MNKDFYCVIMAGGIGSRFWPLSRTGRPKQFLDILGTGVTLLQMTYKRFLSICLPENIFVVTHQDYQSLVQEQLPDVAADHILLEPMRKNTAPCIAYANFRIQKLNPYARIVVAPSDHLIIKEEKFIENIRQGLEFVLGKDAMLTLGIKPSRIETGYGYIQAMNGRIFENNPNLKKVKTFTEKPDYELARVFYESGEFYWNSGIFIWSLPTITRAFKKHLPEIYHLFSEKEQFLGGKEEKKHVRDIYSGTGSISIDYGIMEEAENVYVLCTDFGWSDLGTWGSLHEHLRKDKSGNSQSGNDVFLYDVKNSIVNFPDGKLAIVQGLEGYIVVESENVLLICRKEDEQKIRHFVNDVKIEKGERYL